MEFLSKEGLTYFWSKLKTRFDSLSSATNTNTSEIAVQKARIDSIATLPSGSTTADAELIDIRVKADGTTAETAGNAVREQVSDLNDLINKSSNNALLNGYEVLTERYINVETRSLGSSSFNSMVIIPIEPNTTYIVWKNTETTMRIGTSPYNTLEIFAIL